MSTHRTRIPTGFELTDRSGRRFRVEVGGQWRNVSLYSDGPFTVKGGEIFNCQGTAIYTPDDEKEAREVETIAARWNNYYALYVMLK